jgi:hypothetical protein
MAEFFHASKMAYKVGDIISIQNYENGVNFDHANRSEEDQTINDLLDELRPTEEYPSRSKCIYLFDNIYSCTNYAKQDELNIYKVYVDNVVGPFPFYLVGAFQKYPSFRKQIASEYWNHTLDWKVNEYICTQMKVVEKLKLSNCNSPVGVNRLVSDIDTFKGWLNRFQSGNAGQNS